MKPIWEKKPPKGTAHRTMTPAEKSKASRIAKNHGTKVGLADRLAAMRKKGK
jgi:hypothetical protein